ncbi:MAG: hybrid sensor histidine kinase/response regulator [Elusimicrobiota bacterium]|jgi:signal transduction histidine kinase
MGQETQGLSGAALIVDDDPSILKFCRRALETTGLRVSTASKTAEAWELLGREEFDFVLTDIQLEDASAGVRFIEDLHARRPELDVVMMTGAPSLESALPSLRSGAFDYLVKPFKLDHLQNVARRLLELRRMRRELDREKALRRELEDAYAELRKVERVKTAILARVSHELRTPLSIAGMAAELLAGEAGGEGRKLAEQPRGALARLRGSVEDLLLFAHVAASGLEIERKETDLFKLLEEVVEENRPASAERNLSVELSMGGERRLLSADAGLLRQAFSRLLQNAVRFNHNDGSIRVRLEHSPEDTRVAFFNTGTEIPKEEQDRVFEGFYQVAEHMTRETGGMGVGLAMVRRIVEAHGGSVEIQSSSEGGTTFAVRFPAPPVRTV